jgi:hypothetical protein
MCGGELLLEPLFVFAACAAVCVPPPSFNVSLLLVLLFLRQSHRSIRVAL